MDFFLGHVKPGLPLFQPPPFETQVDNKTYNAIEMVSTLGTAIFVVPLFGILENIALAKAFGKSYALKMLISIVTLVLYLP